MARLGLWDCLRLGAFVVNHGNSGWTGNITDTCLIISAAQVVVDGARDRPVDYTTSQETRSARSSGSLAHRLLSSVPPPNNTSARASPEANTAAPPPHPPP